MVTRNRPGDVKARLDDAGSVFASNRMNCEIVFGFQCGKRSHKKIVNSQLRTKIQLVVEFQEEKGVADVHRKTDRVRELRLFQNQRSTLENYWFERFADH